MINNILPTYRLISVFKVDVSDCIAHIMCLQVLLFGLFYVPIIASCHEKILIWGIVAFVCYDTLCPSQQFFSHVETIFCLPGVNQY